MKFASSRTHRQQYPQSSFTFQKQLEAIGKSIKYFKNSHKILQQRRKDVIYQFTNLVTDSKNHLTSNRKVIRPHKSKKSMFRTLHSWASIFNSKLFCVTCSLICINQCKTCYLSEEALSSSAAKCSSGKGIFS